MSHAPSLLFPSHLSTTSLSTCTAIRPSTRPSTRLSLMSTSYGDLSCADPSNVSFGLLAETYSLAGCKPKDLTEEDNYVSVKPMFFHNPSMTSTYDSADSIATLLLNRIYMMSKCGICWLHRCAYGREKQVPTDHEFITPSEKTQCQVHLTSEKVQGNLPQSSHTKESRVKKHFLTEKAFPQDIKQLKGKTKLYLGRSCEISSWRTKRSSTRRSKIWNIEARM